MDVENVAGIMKSIVEVPVTFCSTSFSDQEGTPTAYHFKKQHHKADAARPVNFIVLSPRA